MNALSRSACIALLSISFSEASFTFTSGYSNSLLPSYASTFSATEKKEIMEGFQVWSAATGIFEYQTQMVLGDATGLGGHQAGTIIFKKINGTWPGHAVPVGQSLDIGAVNVILPTSSSDVGEIDLYSQVWNGSNLMTTPWQDRNFATNALIRAAARILGQSFNSTTGSIMNQNIAIDAAPLIPADNDLQLMHNIFYPNNLWSYPSSMEYLGNAEPLFEFSALTASGQHRYYAWGWAAARAAIANPPAGERLVHSSARYLIVMGGAGGGNGYSLTYFIDMAIDNNENEYFAIHSGLRNTGCDPSGLIYNEIGENDGGAGTWYSDWTQRAAQGVHIIEMTEAVAPTIPNGGSLSEGGYKGNLCQKFLGYAIDQNPSM